MNFWRGWTELTPYRNLDIPQYWESELANFGVSWACFDGRRVMDIGCGPYGLIHFAGAAAERIRIDPLLLQYSGRLSLSGVELSLVGMAESLPLASGSVDIAICHNALDHMLDPELALDEIARVLRPSGLALLMIHTFPVWMGPLFVIDRIHPRHYTAAAFVEMVGGRFHIETRRTRRRRFQMAAGRWWDPSLWKYRLGNLAVSSTWVRAKMKPDPA